MLRYNLIFIGALRRPFFSGLVLLLSALLLVKEALGSPFADDNLVCLANQSTNAEPQPESPTLLSQNSLKNIYSRDKAKAIKAISGSTHPGVIEHFLVRPQPDATTLDSKLSIMLSYPSIGRSDVDADIRNWITEIADTFEQNIDASFFGLDSLTDPSVISPTHIELHGIYDISQPSSKALSITFEVWNKLDNEQPNLDILTLNYSLINGQRLGLSDIFTYPDKALQLMSSFARHKLNEIYGLGRKQMMYRGTEPLIENFSSLTLTPTGICINFQPYQVASWEMGIQKVNIPLEELHSAKPLTILWGR